MTRPTLIALTFVLAACTARTVDLGPNDAADGGGPQGGGFVFDGGAIFVPAAKVNNARAQCHNPPHDAPITGGSPAQVTARLSGVWLLCTYTGSTLGGEWAARDERPYAFTADGSWYALALDAAGDLIAGDAPGVIDGGIAPYRGTYSFDDANGNPYTGGDVGYIANGTTAWFKASFSADGTLLQMDVVDGSTQTFARVE